MSRRGIAVCEVMAETSSRQSSVAGRQVDFDSLVLHLKLPATREILTTDDRRLTTSLDDVILFVARRQAHLRLDAIGEAVAHLFEGDTLHDLIEEALDDDPFGLLLAEATAAEVEEVFRLDLPHRRAVRAAHVV